ncbi:synaptotagmin-3 isoform X2 [Punica granatum]|uniref:Synaptotagmin-3 isoform X2 n=1 Tax=Punica granatum TaxID=22663 RepID=A0A6P8CJU3_PUNGR|nr:synaptotagmin-3 isoform X2 [Punica granatum]
MSRTESSLFFLNCRLQDPVIRPFDQLDTTAIDDILPEIPLWIKNPDYERVDWLNKFILDMWPYLDKAICANIRSIAQPMFDQYIGKFHIDAIQFENLSLGTLPPVIHGIKVFQTNEKELVMEPAIRWAGNPNIVLSVKVLSLHIRIQLVDLQVFAAPRVTLKPLVPTFPCFANAAVSLMEKPYVDFGMKILGADIMSIPGLYRYIQETIKKNNAGPYLWPRAHKVPILDPSTVVTKKPVGILHVKVIRAMKLLKMDLLGASDPYVKLSLTGERLPAKKTNVKRNNLNPEWNENFKFIVKDPSTQTLKLQVYDWDKVGGHDKLGMQLVPLDSLRPYEKKELKLNLKNGSDVDDHHKKQRGHLVVELTVVPFKEESASFKGSFSEYKRYESGIDQPPDEDGAFEGAGLLSVMVIGAEDVEGERHNNPYAIVVYRGDKKKTRMIRKTRRPFWNEEFQFMLDEPPLKEKIHIEVMSKRSGISFRSKESLGHVQINLSDVVHNGRINEKYHLINSKNGVIHVEIRWETV